MEGSFTPPPSGNPPPAPPWNAPPPAPPWGAAPPPDWTAHGGGEPPPPPPPPITPIPWEMPGLPVVTALIETIKLVVTNPNEAFRRMPLNSELVRPVLYALIVGMIGVVAQTIYDAVFSTIITQLLPMFADRKDALFGALGSVIGLFLAPLLIPLGLVIGSGITHLMLLLLGGGRTGWTATFRVFCYSLTSSLFLLIPIVGGLLNFAACLVFQTNGLAVVHGMSRGRAFAALFLPILVCCGCFMLGAMMFGTAMMAGIKDLWGQ